MIPTKPGLRQHIATPKRDIFIQIFGDLMRPQDDVLITQGGGKGLKIYEEIERDPLAFAVLQKRKLGLVARDWKIEPGGPRRQDRLASALAERVFNGEWGLSFDRVSLDLLDANLKGYAVAEIIWDLVDDYYIPVQIKPKDQRRFVFDDEGLPRLLTWESPLFGEGLPERKFLVHRFGDKTGDPYGRGLGHQLFWWVYFKRMAAQFWLGFADKFGTPTVVGEIPDTMLPDDEDKLLAKLAGIAQESAMTVPSGTVVRLLEAMRSGTVTYPDLVEYCDQMITLAVLGETLTTTIGNAGSKAAAEVHSGVKDEIIDADADLLSGTLNGQLLTWMTELNFPGARTPGVWRPRPTREEAQAKTQQEQLKARQMALEYINTMRRSGWEPEDPMADITEQWSGGWAYTGKATGVRSDGQMVAPDQAERDLPAPPPPTLGTGNDQAAVAGLVDQLDQLAGGAMDAIVARIRQLLDDVAAEGGTLEDVLPGLMELYPSLDTGDLGSLIGQAMAVANLTGRADIADGR